MGPLRFPHLHEDSLYITPAGWDEVACFKFLEIMIGILQEKAQTFEKVLWFYGDKSLLKYLHHKEQQTRGSL